MSFSVQSRTLVLAATLLFSVSLAASGATQPFITSYSAAGAIRNNYSGFVGMEFTVGATPVTVASLGRIYLTGNSGAHTLKLVNASTAVAVPGGSVQITMTAGTANSFQYAALAAPVQLAANTAYYLLSQETAGGDQWHDVWPVTTTADAAVNGAVYSDVYGNPVLVSNSAGESYVPVNFLYTPGTPASSPPTVNQVYAYDANGFGYLTADALSPTGLTISSVQFLVNGQNFGPPVTTGPYAFQLPADFSGWLPTAYSITAIATDSANQSGVSLPYSFPSNGNGQTFLTAQTLGTERNNYGNQYGHFVGMEFTAGSEAINIFALGRYAAPGNSQTHLLKLVNAVTGLDVPGGSVTVSMAGATAGQYVYTYLPYPVAFAPNTSYYLLSQELAAGDQWYDYAPVTAGPLGTVNGPVYQSDSGAYVLVPSAVPSSYVPLNMVAQPIPPPYSISAVLGSTAGATYLGVVTIPISVTTSNSYLGVGSVRLQVDGQVFGQAATATPYVYNYSAPLDTTKLSNGAHTLSVLATDALGDTGTSGTQTFNVNNAVSTQPSSAFITSFSPTFLRNNYSGFVGMEFTTGNAAVSVSSLGRICVAGNSGAHIVKLVQALAGTDLPGGSVSVSMAGCTAGQFVYAPLVGAETLAPGASYYLASQETSGGDKWYDYGPVVSGTVATVNGPVYFDGAKWDVVPSPSSSYVPVNFLQTATGGTDTVTVSETLNGSTVTSTASSNNSAIVGVQYKIDGFAYSNELTTAPYTLALPNLTFGTHYIGATARDSLGNNATSTLLTYTVNSCGYSIQGCFPASLIAFPGTAKLRNDYTGWVGFQFTTGPNGSFFSEIGNICVSGNTQPHFVKFVSAATGLDLPGGTAWITPSSSCSGPGFLQTAPAGVALAASTSYYLVSQETSGGDFWYDILPAIPTSYVGPSGDTTAYANFTINGPVYWNGFQYVLVATPNYSYVGLVLGSNVSPI